MDWFREYKDYFILAAALLVMITVWIGYIWNLSLKQQEIFNKRTEKSIKMVLGPMIKALQVITEEEHEPTRFRKLDRFIELYDGAKSPLFSSPSRDLMKQFDFVVQEYEAYNKVASPENHNALWVSVLSLQEFSNKKFESYTNYLNSKRMKLYN